MSRYLFIQSQDPFSSARTFAHCDLARRLASSGHKVSILLVQNAVLVARQGTRHMSFDSLPEYGITLRADNFSLRQREIPTNQMKKGIAPADLDLVIDAMLSGDKVIWN